MLEFVCRMVHQCSRQMTTASTLAQPKRQYLPSFPTQLAAKARTLSGFLLKLRAAKRLKCVHGGRFGVLSRGFFSHPAVHSRIASYAPSRAAISDGSTVRERTAEALPTLESPTITTTTNNKHTINSNVIIIVSGQSFRRTIQGPKRRKRPP